jgi:CRP-like cAMP-binding protein
MDVFKAVRETCVEFCKALTPDEVQRFITYTQVKTMDSHAIISDIGAVNDSFYLIVQGGVHLYQVEGDKEFEVGSVKAGGLVGEMSFFDRKPRTIRLRAYEEGAVLLEINRQRFNRMRVDESYIATNLLEFVIRSLDWLIRNLGEENARLNKVVATCNCIPESSDSATPAPVL